MARVEESNQFDTSPPSLSNVTATAARVFKVDELASQIAMYLPTVDPRSTVALTLLGAQNSSLQGVVEGGRLSALSSYVRCRYVLVLHRLHSGSGTAPVFHGVSES